MIPFSTPVEPALSSAFVKAGYADKILSLGSCFAQNIGDKLCHAKLNTLVNPAGVIFNPYSILKILDFSLEKKLFSTDDISFFNNKWFSYNFHSSLSSISQKTCLSNINEALESCGEYLANSKVLILTFGSAWAYRREENHQIVANCYKIPSKQFKKVFLDLEMLASSFEDLFVKIRKKNPEIQILISVSPVRHWKDGATENQRSKSLLILLAHMLKEKLSFVQYFPAYEIMMDELRDYRFYREDMLHPTELAISHIWEKFSSACLDATCLKIMPSIMAVKRAMNHLPNDKDSEGFREFVNVNRVKIEALQNALPQLNFDEELAYFNQFDL